MSILIKQDNLSQTNYNLNPISHGGGSLGPRATSQLSETPYQLNILECFMLRIPNYLFTNKISKKNDFFRGGHILATEAREIYGPPPSECF